MLIGNIISSKSTLKRFCPSDAELAEEFAEIVKEVDLDSALLGLEGSKSFDINLVPEQIVFGEVISIRSDYVLVDFGYKAEGFLPYHEEGTDNDELDIGDKTHFMVRNISKNGSVFLTRKHVDLLIRQKKVLSTLEVGQSVVGKLIQHNKNGWIVNIGGLPATLPSHQEYLIYFSEESIMDTEIEVEVDSIDGKFVTLSRKSFANTFKKEAKNQFLLTLDVGTIVDGVVKNITDFGIFIQISSGIIGLCHSSDVGNNSVSTGQVVKCRILKIDREKNRVSLGIRQVTEPTWEELVSKYSINDKVVAEVKSLVPYGAFMEVEKGVNGLVHVSDLSWSDHIKHPKEILKTSEKVEVMILGIDMDKQHLSLGLKHVTVDPWTLADNKYIIGSIVEGTITNKTKFGIFISLEKGIEGLAHHTVMSKDLKAGDSVRVMVMRLDTHAKKISLALED